MPFLPEDIERIKQALKDKKHTSDPDLVQLMGLGLNIRTAEEQATYEANLRHQIRGEEEVPAYENIEKTIAELTGGKKKEGEKTSDFLKRTLAEHKQQLQDRQAELDALKKDKGADDPRIATLQGEINRLQSEHEKALKAERKQFVDYRLQGERERIRQRIAQDVEAAGVVEELREDVITARVARFEAEMELRLDEKGVLQTVDRKTGVPVMNPKDLTHLDPVEVAGRYTQDLKKADGGQGSGERYKAPSGDERRKGDYGRARSQVELDQLLMKDGLTSDSKEYIDARKAALDAFAQTAGKPMPIRE